MINISNNTTTFLIGGGPVTAEDLDLIRNTPLKRVVAVDGGANHLPRDLSPDVIIGDLDSLDKTRTWDKQPTILHVTNQNTTDLEKAINHCLGCQAKQPLICMGFIGGRFDQTLTVLHTNLLFLNTQLIFLSGADATTTLTDGHFQFRLPLGSRLSLYPLTPCIFGQSTGLKYQLDGLHMEQGHLIGTSNEVLEPHAEINLISGNCLLIVERTVLNALIAAFNNV